MTTAKTSTDVRQWLEDYSYYIEQFSDFVEKCRELYRDHRPQLSSDVLDIICMGELLWIEAETVKDPDRVLLAFSVGPFEKETFLSVPVDVIFWSDDRILKWFSEVLVHPLRYMI